MGVCVCVWGNLTGIVVTLKAASDGHTLVHNSRLKLLITLGSLISHFNVFLSLTRATERLFGEKCHTETV